MVSWCCGIMEIAHRLANEYVSISYMYVYVGASLTKILNAKKKMSNDAPEIYPEA